MLNILPGGSSVICKRSITCEFCEAEAYCTKRNDGPYLCEACDEMLAQFKLGLGQNGNMFGMYHLRMTLTSPNGDPNNVEMFHMALAASDGDYPIKPDRKTKDLVRFCTKCNGLLWNRPNFEPAQLKLFAKQLGLGIKIHSYIDESKCKNATIVYREPIC